MHGLEGITQSISSETALPHQCKRFADKVLFLAFFCISTFFFTQSRHWAETLDPIPFLRLHRDQVEKKNLDRGSRFLKRFPPKLAARAGLLYMGQGFDRGRGEQSPVVITESCSAVTSLGT